MNQLPVAGDDVITNSNGTIAGYSLMDDGGVRVGDSDPFPADGSADPDGMAPVKSGGPGVLGGIGGRATCELDGIEIECYRIRGDASVQCPNNDCGRPIRVIYQGEPVFAFFQGYGDGYEGYVPITARYIGNGGLASAGSGGKLRLTRMTGKSRKDTDLGKLNGAKDNEGDLRQRNWDESFLAGLSQQEAGIEKIKAHNTAIAGADAQFQLCVEKYQNDFRTERPGILSVTRLMETATKGVLGGAIAGGGGPSALGRFEFAVPGAIIGAYAGFVGGLSIEGGNQHSAARALLRKGGKEIANCATEWNGAMRDKWLTAQDLVDSDGNLRGGIQQSRVDWNAVNLFLYKHAPDLWKR